MARRKVLGKETVPRYIQNAWPLLVDLAVGKTVKIGDEDYRTRDTTVVHRIGNAKGGDAGYNVLERAINKFGVGYDLPKDMEAELNEEQQKKLAQSLLNKYYRTTEGSEQTELFVASIPVELRDPRSITNDYWTAIKKSKDFREITFMGVAQASEGFLVVFTARGSPENAVGYLEKVTDGKGKVEKRTREEINQWEEKGAIRWIKKSDEEKGGIENPISTLKENYEEIRNWRPNVY